MGDSAQVVTRRNLELFASRVSFWVVAVAWVLLCSWQVLGDILRSWTLFVFVAALACGEPLIGVCIRAVRSCYTCCHRRLTSRPTPSVASPEAAQPLDTEMTTQIARE